MEKISSGSPEDRKYMEELEEKLLESYKHLGIINRRIAILLELNKKSGRSVREIIGFIINSSSNFAKTDFVSIFKYDEKDRSLMLLASSKKCRFQKNKILLSAKGNYSPLHLLSRKKVRIQGDSDEELLALFKKGVHFKYFVFLPLTTGDKLKGALFLGFSKSESMATQELDFYEAFASQIAFILSNMKII